MRSSNEPPSTLPGYRLMDMTVLRSAIRLFVAGTFAVQVELSLFFFFLSDKWNVCLELDKVITKALFFELSIVNMSLNV